MSGSPTFTPAYDHIVVVIEENHAFTDIIGNPQAPYLNQIAAGGASLTNYHAITHPSEPNYFALYAGSTFGVADDNDHLEPDPTLASILQQNGETFVGYVENGSPRKHNPWESFPEGVSVERDFGLFPSNDFSHLPSVAIVVPNLNDDMHDGTVQQADQWLQSNIGSYAQWATTHNSLLAIVWDEDSNSTPSNQTPGILYGAHIKPGTYGDFYTHYDLLSTMLDASGLTGPNNAATALGIGNGVFRPTNNDFNGNGSADILWQNSNGAPAVWLMNGTAVATLGPVLSNPGTAWHVRDGADFDGDGKSDILWQNDNGQPAVWLMNGTSVSNFGPALGNPGPTWHADAAADFDGDGKADILWQNDNGAPAVWLMSGTALAGLGPVLTNPGPTWHVRGAGDFNGDGKADILWQNDNGAPAVWLMNGTSVAAIGPVLTNPGPSWHVRDAGDFNGDGKADILWQNDDGKAAVWLMDGTNVVALGPALGDPGTSWHVKEAADVNGDGKADIVWQNDNGQPAAWLMDGVNVVAFGPALGDPGTTWHVI